MDKLLECTRSFEKLLDTQYRIIIGRKGKKVEIVIGFSKLDFHHLMGLGKLKDLRIAKQNRETVFNEIVVSSLSLSGSLLTLVLLLCKPLFKNRISKCWQYYI